MSKPNHETSPHAPGGHPEAHGSSVGFYVFIAVVLGIITYIEFALVEYQDTWFAWMSRFWLFFWLILLSVIKFLLVVMFFMHLKQDDRAFTGFFSSGMVIAVGTLAALAALFTVRSIAEAQTPGEPHAPHAEAHIGEDTRTLAERFEYPAPKTQDVTRTELRPTVAGTDGDSGAGLGADVSSAGGEGAAPPRASVENPRVTPTGLVVGELPYPLAEPAPPVTLPNAFNADGTPASPQAQQEQVAQASAGGAEEAAPAEGEAEEAAATPPAGDAPLLVNADLSAGEAAYSANCASCHQANGAGIPGAFPPLVGHTPDLALAEGGRDYLVNLLLYGLQGEIQVEGQAYNGVMPAWQGLSDEELAGILNYTLSEWDNLSAMPEGYAAFTPEEVAEGRDAGLSAADVYEQRQTLELP